MRQPGLRAGRVPVLISRTESLQHEIMDQPVAPVSTPVPERKLNLLILASGLWIGGAEVVIAHLARNIDRSRFNVTICHLKSRGQIGEELLREGFDVVGLAGHDDRRTNYLTFVKLAKLLREKRIDVVHTHTTHGLVDAVLCKLLVRGLKVIHTFHFGNYPHTRGRIKFMERIFGRRADRLYAVGKTQRAQLQALYRFRESAIGTVWNGVNAPVFDDPAQFRAQHQIPADTILIGTIATLIDQKGLPDLMRVARRVIDTGHKARFVICGEGYMRGELEALRRELKLENDVMLVGWVKNAAQVALPAFDVFFQPSLWEAMSVVLLEAMAAAKPLVATRVGEAPVFVEDGIDGLIVEPRDIEGMSAALARLIDSRELRTSMGAAALRKWQQHFTVQHMTRAYEQIYSGTLAGAPIQIA
jgi:glycosyltransferase involved in cell wall biosynthesis